MNRRLLSPPLLLLLGALALVPESVRAGRVPDVVEDALAFALTDRDKAIQLLEDALAAGPSDRDVDAITAMAGEQRRLAGDSDASHTWFTALLSRTDKGPDADTARLGLALLQSGQLEPKTLRLLEEIPEKNVPATQNADRYYLLAAAAAERGEDARRKEHAATALKFAEEDPAVKARLLTAIEALESAPAGTPAAGGNTAASPRRDGGGRLDKADAALEAGDADEARRLARDVIANATDPALVRAAEYVLRRADGAAVNPRKVAVLLPLEGKYGGVGKQVREALEYGHRAAGGGYALQFVESGATPETAVAALEDAVINDGVIAVVGPLLSDETEAVVAAAEALRVPLLSLSQSLDDTTATEWVVQSVMTPGDQIRSLLDHVMGREKMDAFAVFAPKNTYGERAVELFRTEVEARGGKIVAAETYDPDAPDLIEFAKKLGRKDYNARASEYAQLRAHAAAKGGNAQRVVLPPLLDFDAIFLPDSASRIPLACAALAYEEFPMGDFHPTKESPFIPLLGLSSWNNPTLVSTGGPYTRRSYFVDAFLNEAAVEEPPWKQSEAQAAFVEAYKAAYRRTPSPLEAQVVDAGKLLAAAGKAAPATRTALLEALLGASPKDPVAGTRGIDPNTHRAQRDLLLLSISEDAVVPHNELPPATVED